MTAQESRQQRGSAIQHAQDAILHLERLMTSEQERSDRQMKKVNNLLGIDMNYDREEVKTAFIAQREASDNVTRIQLAISDLKIALSRLGDISLPNEYNIITE